MHNQVSTYTLQGQKLSHVHDYIFSLFDYCLHVRQNVTFFSVLLVFSLFRNYKTLAKEPHRLLSSWLLNVQATVVVSQV